MKVKIRNYSRVSSKFSIGELANINLSNNDLIKVKILNIVTVDNIKTISNYIHNENKIYSIGYVFDVSTYHSDYYSLKNKHQSNNVYLIYNIDYMINRLYKNFLISDYNDFIAGARLEKL